MKMEKIIWDVLDVYFMGGGDGSEVKVFSFHHVD